MRLTLWVSRACRTCLVFTIVLLRVSCALPACALLTFLCWWRSAPVLGFDQDMARLYKSTIEIHLQVVWFAIRLPKDRDFTRVFFLCVLLCPHIVFSGLKKVLLKVSPIQLLNDTLYFRSFRPIRHRYFNQRETTPVVLRTKFATFRTTSTF